MQTERIAVQTTGHALQQAGIVDVAVVGGFAERQPRQRLMIFVRGHVSPL
ncbi:Uncharacterised protein [Yokenella regensburgei]|uniref:Uncharacterized protein n=1 Tax=Yokenella regensburgei TaxID=158877 RepID=A0AB38FWM7_9ENTR|nr:Uncharacterised protein [Yokenella regensburgei]